jgi:LmbE family N-acetylglucosaminyl deacetylase
MRAAAWLVETVAVSSSRLNGSIATVAVLLFRRAQIQSPIANRIAKESARKKLVVVTSLSVKSEPLIRSAPDAKIKATSLATNPRAAIRIARRQKSWTDALALAGRATARRYATPPSINASKASVAARSTIVRRSISGKSQIKIFLGFYFT